MTRLGLGNNPLGYDTSNSFGTSPDGFIQMEVDNVSLYQAPFTDANTNPGHSAKVTTVITNAEGTFDLAPLDPSLPTYVVTHGWQPSHSYTDSDWNFASQGRPVGQTNIANAIATRLAAENAGSANIILFEWEGAYTAGIVGDDNTWVWNGSSQARTNADYAGALLGRSLQDILGNEYSQSMHFVGHSYGTIVNGLATRFLGDQGVFEFLDDFDVVQFTTLDAPTDAPDLPVPGFAPNFDSDWVTNNISPRVNYLDNYYGHLLRGDGSPEHVFFENVLTYGEPLDDTQTDQPVPYAHARFGTIAGIFDDFYPNLVKNGANDSSIDASDWLVSDWVTPTLFPVAGDYFAPGAPLGRAALTNEFIMGLGAPVRVTELPGFATYEFVGLLLPEQSPVSALQILDIPIGAIWLAFDWMVGVGGDGDWVTVHFGDNLLWSMSIDESFASYLFNAIIDISEFSGTADALLFSLNNVGDKNAQFYVGNLELRGNIAPVPLPSALSLFFGTCLAGLGVASRLRTRD